MSTPYPPPPKKLERSTSNKVLGGVCGGVAKYLNMDPTLVRVLTVVISVFTGFPVIAYIIALFVIPEEGSNTGQQNYPPVNPPQTYDQGYAADSYQQPPTAEPAYGAGPSSTSSYGASAASQPSSLTNQAAPSNDDAVWGTEGVPWEQRNDDAPSGSGPAPDVHAEQVPAHHEPAEEGAEPDETPESPAAKPPGEGPGFDPRT